MLAAVLPAQRGPTFLLSQKSGHRTNAQADPSGPQHQRHRKQLCFPVHRQVSWCLARQRLCPRKQPCWPRQAPRCFDLARQVANVSNLSVCKTSDEREGDSSQTTEQTCAAAGGCLHLPGAHVDTVHTRAQSHMHTQPMCKHSCTCTCAQVHAARAHTHPRRLIHRGVAPGLLLSISLPHRKTVRKTNT